MCGIVGYVGQQTAAPIVLAGLKRLEYRGYDSAGICEVDAGLKVFKSAGTMDDLKRCVQQHSWVGKAAIGHTRWATHGVPNEENAHPHLDCTGQFAVVHNGIIENYYELRSELLSRNHRFASETDTEVVAHLVEEHYDGDLLRTVQKVVKCLHGSFALAVASCCEPDALVVARQDSPLVLGRSADGCYLASDVPAILEHTNTVCFLEDGHIARLQSDTIEVFPFGGSEPSSGVWQTVPWTADEAQKDGYADFMAKEIQQQPAALMQTLQGRLSANQGVDIAREVPVQFLQGVNAVHLTACGTAYHACLYGADMLRQMTDWSITVELASEYRYNHLRPNAQTLVIAVSQSGETADTLGAVRKAQQAGAKVLAVTNVMGSRLAREAEAVMLTQAGPEIAVASTKAYTTQLVCLAILAAQLGVWQGCREQGFKLAAGLRQIPDAVAGILCAMEQPLQQVARRLAAKHHCFYLGRGLDYVLAMEGQLKLKEISYIHAEALAAGELKHGSLALIEAGTPVVAVMTQPHLAPKLVSNLKEVRARGGDVLLLAAAPDPAWQDCAQTILPLPRLDPNVGPIAAVVALQMLAYYTAKERGCDVDRPRNLAKSVTVE